MIRHIFQVFVICLPVWALAQNTPLTKPIVMVKAGPDGNDELGAGFITGELNNKLYIVTADHVVKDFPDMIRIKLAGYPEEVVASIARREPSLDLAVLTIPTLAGYSAPSSFAWADQLPDLSDELVVVGHPNGAPWDVNRVVRLKAVDVPGDYFGTQLSLYDNGLDNGNSGGVVLNQAHQLIAMVQEVSGSQASCLRASVIQKVLEQNGLPDNLMAPSSYTDPHAGDMVWVEGGTFMMGRNENGDNENPLFEVSLDGFWMGKFEVTNEQFCVFLNEKGNQNEEGASWLQLESPDCDISRSGNQFVPKPGKATHPVRVVTWYGAKAYTAWMSSKTGHSYRLPTEAQWEYAARGGQNERNTTYAGSNSADEVAWYSSNSNSTPHPVGQKAANELGLYDMSGNVWEWCADWAGKDYNPNSSYHNPTGPSSGTARIIGGGSWDYSQRYLRIAQKGADYPGHPYLTSIGFRLSRTP